MSLAGLARQASQFAIRNSPTILTTVGVVGAVATTYLVGKASFEAANIIRLKENSDDERGVLIGSPRDVLEERVKLVWKLYIPPAVTLAATVACVIGANQIGNRRYAGLAAATTIIERGYEEYKEKVKEKLGDRKAEAIHDEIAEERVAAEATYLEDVKLHGLDEGELCWDMFGDRPFRHTYEGIRGAVNELNFNLIHNGNATLSDFYAHLGISSPAFSENIGWNSDVPLEIRLTSVLKDGKPWIAMDFKTVPKPDYGYSRFH